jgi:tRNA(fMet)-specific endonuclease VapC
MRYLLDTCVISDFIKGETGTTARLKQTPPADTAISTITVMELRYGLALNPQRAQKVEPAITSILSSVTILSFGTAEAEQAAQSVLLSNLKGNPLGLTMF